MQIMIQQETPSDYQMVENLIKSAFKTAPHSDGNEHLLVNQLRNSPSFIPELSLIAKIGNEKETSKIVGHILLTKIQINNHTELALAPLSVLPEYQNQGIGKALINQAHTKAKALGFNAIVLLGEPNYYGKFGYQTASDFNITAPFDVPNEYYQVLFLSDKTDICGTVVYDQAFGI